MEWRWRYPAIEWKLLPYKLFYLALSSGEACLGPFLPVFFHRRGLKESQIGLLGFLRPIVGILTVPLWTMLTDRWGLKKAVLLITVLGSTLFRFLFMYSPSFSSLIPLVVLANTLGGAPDVLADAFTMEALEDKSEYGKQRLWGAVGWGLAAPVCGAVVSATRIEALFWLHSLFMVVSALVATQFRFSAPHTHCPTKQACDGSVLGGDSEHQGSLQDEAGSSKADTTRLLASTQSQIDESRLNDMNESSRDILKLSKQRGLQILSEASNLPRSLRGDRGQTDSEEWKAMFPADDSDQQQFPSSGQEVAPLLIHHDLQDHPNTPPELQTQASDTSSLKDSDNLPKLAATFRKPNVVCFLLVIVLMGMAMGTIDNYLPLRLTELGGDPTVIGLALTVTCIAEVPLMWLSGRLIKSLGVLGVLYLALACYVARFVCYSLLRKPWVVLPIELLHGVTFGCGWTAGTVQTGRIAPPGLEATMQAIFYGAYFGIGNAAGILGGGFMYEHFGSVVLFQSAGIVTCIGAVLYALSQRWCPLEEKRDEQHPQAEKDKYAAIPLKELASVVEV